ncbi:MAG: glycerate kinase [Chloroflexota bacterium]|nr:glycerate kinase [Chloroflexota bacterium]
MKIIIAPNSFKGSLSAHMAAEQIAAGLRRSGLAAEYHLLPLADGGDGTLEAFLSGGGTIHTHDTTDALGRPIRAQWGMLADGSTAIVEMARASGLALLTGDRITAQAALSASSYGTGLLIRAALDTGVQRIILGLGGSATTDGGAGCLHALGVRFLDATGYELSPGGGDLVRLASIDLNGVDPRIRAIEWVIASDVVNPALGVQGAARVFAPQKGADLNAVEQLEQGLSRLFEIVAMQTGRDVRAIPGGGAAGAFAAGMMAFTGATVVSGIDLLLDTIGFDALCHDASLVITGEGQIDEQTLGGKAPHGVAVRAAGFGVPAIALVGSLRVDDEKLHAAGFTAAFPIVTYPMTLDAAVRDAGDLLERAALRLGYVLQLGKLHDLS